MTLGPGAGEALPRSERDYFAPRFGRSLDGVRVHQGGAAGEAARALGARAFTVRSDIVFGHGEYQPGTARGRRLLAHELTHTFQQEQGPPRLQRTLVVAGPDPAELAAGTTDPASALDPAARNRMVEGMTSSICPGFTVNDISGVGRPDSTGEVVSSGGVDCSDSATVAGGSRPVGCCCLCILVSSPNVWTIRIVDLIGASTDEGARTVFLPPSTSPLQSGHWTAGAPGAPQRLVQRPRLATFGHEVCGHAALMEIGAHPAHDDRARSDVHDPTIKVERAIWGEQGLPAADIRGLARGGSHRGESVLRVTIDQFDFNSSDTTRLPSTERDKLTTVANLLTARDAGGFLINDRFVDLIGHGDRVGPEPANRSVSDARARQVREDLVAAGVSRTISAHGLSVNRFRLAGLGHAEPLSGATDPQERRVEIIIASFPAGTRLPVPGTPTTMRHVAGGVSLPDACENRLSTTAWT